MSIIEQRNNIITSVYQSQPFNTLISKIDPQHLQDDLKSEVVLVLMNKQPNFIIDLDDRGMIERYAMRVAVCMIKNKNGRFYNTFRKKFDANIPEISLPELNGRVRKEMIEDKAMSLANNLYWYEKELLMLYIRLGSYRLVSKETGIPFRSCGQTIRTALDKIKVKLSEQG